MSKGWIKIHRQITDWEWYDEPNTFRLFFHLLLKANHKQNKYRGVMIEPGQIMTGFDRLANETGLTLQKVRTSINRLKSTDEITVNSSTQGTIIQIVNYSKYQVATDEQQTDNKPITNKQQTNNKPITTNKNDKKEENEGEVIFNFKKSLLDYGFTDTLVNDWLMVRKNRKATNSETAYKSFIKVIEDCKDVDKNIILTKCVEKSWAGVQRDWLENVGLIKQAPKPFIYR
jgi:asparagine N-glycosylation enzyme membrane subunit Stt3